MATTPQRPDFTAAEVEIIVAIAKALSRGLDDPDWATKALLSRPALRRAISAILTRLSVGADGYMGAATAEESLRQATRAARAARRLAKLAPTTSNAIKPTVIAPPLRETHAVREVMPQVLRSTDDIFRKAVAQVMVQPITTEKDRLAAVESALAFLTRNGVTAFVDRAGRRWNLTSYLEMATRTALARSASDWFTHELTRNGVDLVRVSEHPDCAPQCLPFQGRLLSITGATRGPVGVGADGSLHEVVASLAEARARGYEHPGCRHVLLPWVPGDDLAAPVPVDPQVYRDEQQLRALERKARVQRYHAAAAISPARRTRANAALRATQAAIRAHVHATGVRRQRHRESLGPR